MKALDFKFVAWSCFWSVLSLFQQSIEKLPKKPSGVGSITLPSSELAVLTKLGSCWGHGVTGSSVNVWRRQVGVISWELGEGRAGGLGAVREERKERPQFSY